MPPRTRGFLWRYGVAVVAVALATVLRLAVDPWLGGLAPLPTFYLALMFAAWYGGLGPSILALVLAVLSADYLFISPRGSLFYYDRSQLVEVGLYAAVGVAFAVMSASLEALRRKAQARTEELAESEQRTRAIVDHVIDGIITIDEQGIVQSFNPAAETIFGHRSGEVIGRNVNVLMPDPDRVRHDSYVGNYLRTGERKIIGIGREVSGRRKDGSTFPMDLAVSEFRMAGRRFFVGMVRDITDRRRSEETARFLADASAALATLVDYRSTLETVANLAVPFFADWSAVDVLGSGGTLERLATARRRPESSAEAGEQERQHAGSPESLRVPAHVARTDEPEMVADVAEAMRHADTGEREHLQALSDMAWRSYLAVPLKVRGKTLGVLSFAMAESGRRYRRADLSLAEDMAQRAAVAVENARLYEETREADRRKDVFLAMLAHELRNPLAPIRSGLDLMSMDRVDEETVRWARNMMKEQVEHLVRLVDDLLDVSRITRGKIALRKEPVDLSTLVVRGVQTARPLVESRGHELLLSLPAEPVSLQADPIRLTQVIANLLNNAAKYNDKPGHIWVSAGREGDQAVIRVRDDGIGIAADLLPKIFDLFTQADRSLERSQGGLGIGLTLAHSLVEMHGGTIQARSDGPGQGSEFVVRVPAEPAVKPNGNGKRPAPAEHPAETEVHRRLLIVDDNVASAMILGHIAHKWGCEVQMAHDGLEALQLVQTFRPDAVLLDIGLPGMNGYDVARRLRAQPEFAHTLLIAITGYGQEEDRRRSRDAGFDQHLVKPVAPGTLHELLAGEPTPVHAPANG